MVGHGGSSAGSYLADPTSPIPSHSALIVVTSTLRVNFTNQWNKPFTYLCNSPNIGCLFSVLSRCKLGRLRLESGGRGPEAAPLHWSWWLVDPAMKEKGLKIKRSGFQLLLLIMFRSVRQTSHSIDGYVLGKKKCVRVAQAACILAWCVRCILQEEMRLLKQCVSCKREYWIQVGWIWYS